ncbi:cupin domain-containing protein [bacterium]|nr:MAG: cupin domain-containing protein [bacterium]
MKKIALASAVLSTVASALTVAAQENLSKEGVSISPSASRTAQPGPEQNFTGKVDVKPLFEAKAPGRTGGSHVTFPPGARTAWHTHPLGQTLVVTDGTGWVGQWGGETQTFRKGDVAWIPANVKHWHGATATTAMSHIAIYENLNGSPVEWMEKVTDEQYRKGAR